MLAGWSASIIVCWCMRRLGSSTVCGLRSDAIKQEAWLLAGEGRTRTAAQLELVPL